MADAYTAYYNLTKVEVGASANTWGTKLNANFDTIDSTLNTLATGKLALSGGTLTGALTLAADPTAALGAATKQYVDNAVSTGAGGVAAVPTGAILPYGGGTAPSGYLACDGSAVSRATYAALFTALSTTWGAGNGSTTFNVPDLRGEFMRGWDSIGGTARSVDTGRALGSAQSGQVQAHTHDQGTLTTNTTGAHTHDLPSTGASGGIGTGSQKVVYAAGSNNGAVTYSNGDHSHTISGSTGSYGTGTETRPRNVAVNFIIKT